MSSEHLQHQRNFEQNTLVWLDESLNDNVKLDQIKLKLRQIINYVKIFENADECIDYMSTNEKEQIYFLISGSLADIIVPLIYEMKQIKFIYIFSMSSQYHGKLALTFQKIHGSFTDSTILCDALRQDILTKKSSTYNSSTLLLSALPSTASERSDRQEAAFMYFRLLAELLVELQQKQSTKDEFISMCRSQYDGNTSELEKIEEFSRTYSKEHAIRWYTRDSFLYRILNNALRTQDIDILFKLGFFIADLYNQLAILFSKQSKSMMLPSVVYRGQFMSKDEFDIKILKNIGGFLSINSFFSTSANKQVASMFIGSSASNDSDIESVLFEITIEIQKCRQPVADIKHLSHMEAEDEILFSMAAVFRIESVQKSSSENIWIVHLLMNGEEDEELNAVANSIRKELGDSDSMNTFGVLLTKMGEYENAEQYYLMLIEDTQFGDSSSKARYYSNLSLAYSDQRNYDAAISCAEKSLQLQSLHPYELAGVYTNLGLFHVNKGNAVQAFEYLHKAENLYKFFHRLNDLNLGQTYMCMGSAYKMENNHSQAMEYFLKAIGIFRSSLPANHPHFAVVYSHIGSMYMKNTDYESAVSYFLKCLHIQQRSLSGNHPNLVHTYMHLGKIYSELGNEVEAYNSFQKALEIISSLPNHPLTSYVMDSVGSYYKRKNKVSEALNFYEKALDVQMKSTSPDYILIIKIYHALVELYVKQHDWIKVIEYCERAISLAVTYNHKNVPIFYFTIALAYVSIKMYEMGLRYIELALDIGRETLPADHYLLQQLKEQRGHLCAMISAIRNNSRTAKNRSQTN